MVKPERVSSEHNSVAEAGVGVQGFTAGPGHAHQFGDRPPLYGVVVTVLSRSQSGLVGLMPFWEPSLHWLLGSRSL